jgi:glycosyltransferase involved in cell wall biosynthesis
MSEYRISNIKMRIIYFSKSYTPHDYRFLSSLARTKHEIFLLQLESTQRQTEDRSVPANVRQLLWAGGKGEFRWLDVPKYVLSLRKVIREVLPDIIHAGPIQNCAFLVALSGFRQLLTMSWGYDLVTEADNNAWMRWVTRYTLKRSAFFTSDANVTREKAISFGMNPEHTVVFPWGIDLRHFTPKTFKRRNVRTFTLFCSRTWEAIYGVDVLAQAFVRVAKENPNVDLILLGGGSQGNHIRRILMNGDVMERVHFGGQVGQRDLPRWYHMADIYISPSHVDGTSISLLEGLACGMPCLVSDIPGNTEWIEDGVNGWLFRDGDVDDLAEKILFAVKNRKSFKKIGEEARKTAEQKADWKTNFGKLLEAYDIVAKEPHSGD